MADEQVFLTEINQLLAQGIKAFIPNSLGAPIFRSSGNQAFIDTIASSAAFIANYRMNNYPLTDVYYREKKSDVYKRWDLTPSQVQDKAEVIDEIVCTGLDAELQEKLSQIRVTYSILRDFPKFMMKKPMDLSTYRLIQKGGNMTMEKISLFGAGSDPEKDARLITRYTGGTIDVQSLVSNPDILRSSDVFGISRLLLIMELFVIVRAALAVLQNTNNNQLISEGLVITAISKLIYMHLEFMQHTNRTADDGGVAEVYQGYVNGVQSYDKQTTTINDLDKYILKTKQSLKGNVELVNDQKKVIAKRKRLELVAFSIAVVLIIGCIVILLKPLEYTKKVMYFGVLFLLAIFATIGIKVLPNIGEAVPMAEGFGVATPNPGVQAAKTSQIAAAAGNYNIVALQYVAAVIADTIMLSTLLQGTRAFNNLSFTMLREIDYYKGISGRIRNTNDKTFALYRLKELESHKLQATAYFVVNAIMIISGTLALYVAAEKMPELQPYVIALGSGIGIIALMLYLVDIARRVRSDGDKIYWGKPSSPR